MQKQICNDVGLYSDYDNSDDEMVVKSSTNKAQLLDIPFHVLQEFCFGVEYLNVRATCKLCRLAIPVTIFETAYPLGSPWLMVFEKDQISFRDPMFGDKYFKKVSPKFLFDKKQILCSKYGWLLMFIDDLVFFNPFTREIIKLPPQVPCLGYNFCFSAPPTSGDCMVVGFTVSSSRRNVYIHFVGREPFWRNFDYDFGVNTYSFGSPTFCGRDVYSLFNKGVLKVFSGFHNDKFCCKTVVADAPGGCTRDWATEYFLVKCDQHILLVAVRDFGGSVQVFKMKDCRWEKMNGLGRHVIFLSGESCICMDAKTPEMENKIFFPRLHYENGKIVFYSMETCRYHTFNGYVENLNFYGTKEHIDTHAWIEPSW